MGVANGAGLLSTTSHGRPTLAATVPLPCTSACSPDGASGHHRRHRRRRQWPPPSSSSPAPLATPIVIVVVTGRQLVPAPAQSSSSSSSSSTSSSSSSPAVTHPRPHPTSTPPRYNDLNDNIENIGARVGSFVNRADAEKGAKDIKEVAVLGWEEVTEEPAGT